MTIDELNEIVCRDLCISSPEMDVYRKCPHSAIRCNTPLFRKEDSDLLTNAAEKCNSIIRYYEDEYTARAYSVSAYEEWFYTSKGRFVDRKEAMKIAYECGQLKK